MPHVGEEPLIIDGKRIDGRKVDEIRPVKITVGILDKADGSAKVEYGDTKAIVGVYGPRELHPRHDTVPDKAVVRCKYDMMSFSVEDRARPGPSRRSTEISKVLSEALEAVVYTEKFPGMAIDVFVEVYQAAASTRTVGLTAAALALADAGIPMRDLVTSVAFGKIQGLAKNKPVEALVADVCKVEDNSGLVDCALAIVPGSNKIVLCQMDGIISPADFKKGLKLGIGACQDVYKLQKEALKLKFKGKKEGSK